MEVGGKMVGAALCTNDGRKGWINRLAVDPKHRRIGIASMLVKEAERRFDARGLGISACLVHNDNPSSIALFEDLGYTLDSRVLYYSKRKSDRI
jgi:ribosomal protein S18 acetylase RimI-like enzyme